VNEQGFRRLRPRFSVDDFKANALIELVVPDLMAYEWIRLL
jgi:hypothetical protein